MLTGTLIAILTVVVMSYFEVRGVINGVVIRISDAKNFLAGKILIFTIGVGYDVWAYLTVYLADFSEKTSTVTNILSMF